MAESKMKIYRVTDPEFVPYGRLLSLPTDEIIAAAAKLPMPVEGSKYEPSISAFDVLDIKRFLANTLYGEMAIQLGCCWGHNRSLNALEWHKSSELNIAVTDFVLFLGRLQELQGNEYDSSHVRAFLVKKGESIEIYATTLHFCPCTTDEKGFYCIVGLPEKTNLPLTEVSNDPLLFRKNKWLICHDGNDGLKARGVYPGIHGENYSLE